jgi:hypothetical protein
MKRLICVVVAALAIVACKPASAPKEGAASSGPAGSAMPGAPASAGSAPERGAPLFDLGNFKRAVTTHSDEAQRYFNQGMVLT